MASIAKTPHATSPDTRDTLYQMLVEHSLAGMYVIQDGEYVYLNQAVAQILGYSRDELMAMGPRGQFLHEDDRARIEDNLRRREAGETDILRYVARCRRKDGQIVHFQIHGGATEHEGKRVAIGTLLDVTEQKRLEQALQASETELLLKYDLAPDMFASVDVKTGLVLECNQTLATAAGTTKADIIGQPAV